MWLDGLTGSTYLEKGSLVALVGPLRHPCGLGHVRGLDRYLSFRISLAIPSLGFVLSLLLLGLETSASSIFRHESSEVKTFWKKESVRLIYSKNFQTHLLHCPRFGRRFASPWSGWCDQWTFAQWLATQIRWSGTASTIRRTSQRRRRRKPTKEPTTIKKEYKSTSVICIRAFWKFLTWIKLTTRTIFKMRQLFIAYFFLR